MNIRPIIGSSEDELPLLTPKQAAFVDALLAGKTASDAYRHAYDCEYMSQGAISVEAQSTTAIP